MSLDLENYFHFTHQETDAVLDLLQSDRPEDRLSRPPTGARRLSPQSTLVVLLQIERALANPAIPHDKKHVIAEVLRRAVKKKVLRKALLHSQHKI